MMEQASNEGNKTPVLLTQEYLRKHGLRSLLEKYEVNAHRHKFHPNLIQFKYDMIRSPLKEPIVKECRGLILDEDDNWNIVAFPFYKFFNYNEPYADELDWNNITVFEKLDGSLATLYWYKKDWYVASSSIPDASGTLPGGNNVHTFRELFWDIWQKNKYQLPTNKRMCYMFEMLTPRNIIVVKPEKEQVVLIGARDLSTLNEVEPEVVARKYGWECVKTFPMKSLDQILEASKKINPAVTDKNWKRVKVKSPQYVAFAHISKRDKNKMNDKNMLKIVRMNEGDEFIAYFPEHKKIYDRVKLKYDALAERIQKLYDKSKDLDDSKFDDFLVVSVPRVEDREILAQLRESETDSCKIFFEKVKISDLISWIETEPHPSKNLPDISSLAIIPPSRKGAKTGKKKRNKWKRFDLSTFEVDDESYVEGLPITQEDIDARESLESKPKSKSKLKSKGKKKK